jgi:hypothetical protein
VPPVSFVKPILLHQLAVRVPTVAFALQDMADMTMRVDRAAQGSTRHPWATKGAMIARRESIQRGWRKRTASRAHLTPARPPAVSPLSIAYVMPGSGEMVAAFLASLAPSSS